MQYTRFKVQDVPILFKTYSEAMLAASNRADKYNAKTAITAYKFASEYGEELLLDFTIVKYVFPNRIKELKKQ